MRNISAPQRQIGSSLIVSLIILIVLMLLGVTAVTISNTQYKISGNLKFSSDAFNYAESAIAAAEKELVSTDLGKNGIGSYDPQKPYLYPIGYSIDVLNANWDDGDSEAGGNGRYLIQQISFNDHLEGANAAMGGHSSTACNDVNTYLITARGKGERGAVRFIQVYYGVLSCR